MTLSTTLPNPSKTSHRNDIIRSAISGMTPPPKMSVSDWADTYRQMPPDSPIKGRWRTSNAPYQATPMNMITNFFVKIIVLMWGSQLGKTEVLLNIMGKHMHLDPASMMMILPTLDLVEGFSDERVQPMIDLSPDIKAQFGDGKSRDKTNQKKKKTFQGGYLVFAGANSPTSLASRPIQVILMDEIDKFKSNIGSDGDPITQALQRSVNFHNAEKLMTSTPSLAGKSAIEKWWLDSQQFYFEVPCPECQTYQFLDFFPQKDEYGEIISGYVDWPEGQPSKAAYHCKECGSLWSQKQIKNSLKLGEWRTEDAPNEDGIVGYHINSLYSFASENSVVNLARLWEKANGTPTKEQTFYNLKLGLPYEQTKSSNTTPQQLYDRREGYTPDMLPEDVLVITAGVDVQHNRLEVQWTGWGVGDENWVIDLVKIAGDPSDHRLWDELAKVLEREFPHPSGKTIKARAVGIDSGYMTQKVYDYSAYSMSLFKRHYAIKGVSGQGKPIWTQSGAQLTQPIKLYLVGVDDAKLELHANLAKKEMGPGYIHLPGHLDLEFFEQLVSERMEVQLNNNGTSRINWVLPSGKRAEALDTKIYSHAVRYGLSIDYEMEREQLYADDEADEMTLEDLAGAFNS